LSRTSKRELDRKATASILYSSAEWELAPQLNNSSNRLGSFTVRPDKHKQEKEEESIWGS
jgi:hypothetical protein